MKMSAAFNYEIKGTEKDKILNFLKGCFSIIGGPIDIIFGVFSEAYVRLPKVITSQFFSRYSQSYSNLHVKRFSKPNGLLQRDGQRWGRQIICT